MQCVFFLFRLSPTACEHFLGSEFILTTKPVVRRNNCCFRLLKWNNKAMLLFSFFLRFFSFLHRHMRKVTYGSGPETASSLFALNKTRTCTPIARELRIRVQPIAMKIVFFSSRLESSFHYLLLFIILFAWNYIWLACDISEAICYRTSYFIVFNPYWFF